MTEDEAIKALKEVWSEMGDDPEVAHATEDELLIDIITSIGWTRFVEAYAKVTATRWYA